MFSDRNARNGGSGAMVQEERLIFHLLHVSRTFGQCFLSTYRCVLLLHTETRAGLYVKLTLLFDFNHNCNVLSNFTKTTWYQIS